MTLRRSALITAASRGIGARVARGLAHQGFSLTLTGRDELGLHAVEDKVYALGSPAVNIVAGDAGAGGQAARLVDAHATAFVSMDCYLHHPVGLSDSPTSHDQIRRIPWPSN